MKRLLIGLVAVMLQALPALARDMVDEKTHEYTPYGLAIALIAGAQVREMNCSLKGQIGLALAKVKRMSIPIDLDDKEDFSAVVLRTTQIMAALSEEDVPSWCKAQAASWDAFLRSE